MPRAMKNPLKTSGKKNVDKKNKKSWKSLSEIPSFRHTFERQSEPFENSSVIIMFLQWGLQIIIQVSPTTTFADVNKRKYVLPKR
jgi:hypothetical protein